MRRAFLAGVTARALGLPTVAVAQDPIPIGIPVELEGAFAEGGRDAIRGIEMALCGVNNQIAGRRIETVVWPIDACPDVAVRQARELIERDRADFVIGPLSGSEGIAIRDYAETQPDKTFISGSSGALEATWMDPAPNVFRFHTPGLQSGAGPRECVECSKGRRRIAAVGADCSSGHTYLTGFAIDFCRAGGDIVCRFSVPLGAIRLDESRQAIGAVLVSEVTQRADGAFCNRTVRRIDDVDQTLGLPLETFRGLGMPGRDTPNCARLRRSSRPGWRDATGRSARRVPLRAALRPLHAVHASPSSPMGSSAEAPRRSSPP